MPNLNANRNSKADMDNLTKENDWEIPEATSGWIVALRPKYQDAIDDGIARLEKCRAACGACTCGWSNLFMDACVGITKALVELMRALPIDDCTHVSSV